MKLLIGISILIMLTACGGDTKTVEVTCEDGNNRTEVDLDEMCAPILEEFLSENTCEPRLTNQED